MSNKFKVKDDIKGKRFDIAASEMLPELSRAFVHKLIEGGRILLNSRKEKAGYKLRQGDEITIDFDINELDQIPDIELPIIYEDDNVIVIDKPAGVISHSRGKYWNEPSVASFIRQKTGLPGQRSGIVHRLDRATSGVMICTKNQESMKFLQKQFSERKVDKTYQSVITGHLKDQKAIVDLPIERNPKLPSTFRVGSNGKPSVTEYEVIKTSEKHDLILLKPKTGRTHQLRVHLAYLKHPILGDNLYNGEPADRLYLHASTLKLKLPGETKAREFVSPLPEQFNAQLM